MPEYFVWTVPSAVQLVEAASEQDAVEAFLHLPVTAIPVRGDLPACFVQASDGLSAPGIDGSPTGFWVNNGDPPG